MSLETQPSSQSFDIEHLQELLRPIREVAALWDIKLKDYLEDYLENISNIDLSKDFDPKMLNFSQAGLFLQGSTNVLAKKVKNLYDLVLNSTATNFDGNENDPDQKKRKKKVIEFVVDDQLVDLDDLPECDPTIKNADDQSNYEVTTMPKIPFCLLGSLDSSQSDGNSFRISEVPSQDRCVILLDKSVKFDENDENYELYSNENESHSQIPSILSDDFVINNPNSFQSPSRNLVAEDESLPNPGDLVENSKDKENEQNEENKENKETNENQINNENGELNDKNPLEEMPPLPDFQDSSRSSDDEEMEYNPNDFKMLDPNSTQLQFTSKPFKKIKRFVIPTTFLDSKRKVKKTTKKPFHSGIFYEIFEKGKKYREKRTKEEDKKAFELLIEEEGGRDHVLNDMDAYVDVPLPDYEESNTYQNDNDDMPTNSEIIIDNDDYNDNTINMNDDGMLDYREKCQEIIKRIIDMGKMQVHQSHTAQVLENWEKKVTPILEEEKTHKAFVVPDVQEWVKDTLISHKGSIYFRELTCNHYNFEISRIFLAILMLGNAGEVILPSETPPNITNDFLIKLAPK